MTTRLLLGLALALAVPVSASASELVDFDTYPDGTPVPEGWTISDQWAGLGVVFTQCDSVSALWCTPQPECAYSPPNHTGGSGQAYGCIFAWFVDPATGAPATTDFAGARQDWCWWPGEGIIMQAYDSQGHLLAETFSEESGGLVTFSFPEPIIAVLRVEFFVQAIDDFVFNPPVPPTGVSQLTWGNIKSLYR